MTDPIEMIQTAISVSKEVCSAIKSIKDAPNELKTLDIEVSRMLPILEHLFMISVSCTQDQERDGIALSSLCDESRKLVELAKGILEKNEFGNRRLPAKKWAKWLLDRSNRQELVKRFEKMNLSVVTYLSYDGHRGLNRLQETVHGWMITLSSQLEMHQQSTMQHQRQLEDMNDAIRTIRRCITDETRLQIKQHSAAVMQYNASPQEVGSGPDRCNPPEIRIFMPVTDALGIVDAAAMADVPPLSHGGYVPLSAMSSFTTTGSLYSHLTALRATIGDYYCPTWFAHISVELQTQCIPVHFYIRTPRVVQKLGWLDNATLEEVQQKLWSRELTVNDVRPDGYSALHTVTWRLILEGSEAALSIVALLIEHSAPTEWEFNGSTPAEGALWWSLEHWRNYGSPKAAFDALQFGLGLYLRLDIEDVWEEVATKLRWTDLHRHIYALPSHSPSPDLSSLPQRFASQINTKDADGWTPLFYAMSTSPAALVALLQSGANPRIGRNILAWAAEAGADTAISILVRAGVYINKPGFGRTALHWAALPDLRWCMNGLSVVLELIRHAGHLLDWVAQNETGYTPLDYARERVDNNPADEDSQRILELYRTRRLPDGAQYLPTPQVVETEDDETDLPPTSLIRAALRGDINAIGDLITQGAMVNERDQEGRTLLHLVALGRVPNGFRVALELVRYGGWGVDWDALTADDQTALEIVDQRLGQEELSDAESEETVKVCNLLKSRRLPDDEEYLWPCMRPDFYSLEHEPETTTNMPGAWDEE